MAETDTKPADEPSVEDRIAAALAVVERWRHGGQLIAPRRRRLGDTQPEGGEHGQDEE